MSTISIKIKIANEAAFPLTVHTSDTVLTLKELIHQDGPGDIHPDNQRLIFSGKVLKNEQTLEMLYDGCTIHLVHGQRKPDSTSSDATKPKAESSSESTGNTSNTQSSAGENLFDGPNNASNPQSPFASMFSQFMGGQTNSGSPLAGMMNPEMMNSLYSNPEVQRSIQSLMSNPAQIQALLSNPAISSMMASMFGAGAGANAFGAANAGTTPSTETSQSPNAADPSALLRSLLGQQGNNNGTNNGQPDFSSMFPFMFGQAAAGATPQSPNSTETPASTASTGPNPYAALMNPQLINSILGGLGNGQFPSPTATQTDSRPIEERYETQLRQLSEMGFTDPTLNVRALTLTGGNLEAAIEWLFSNRN